MAKEIPLRTLGLYTKFTAKRETDLERQTRFTAKNKEDTDRAIEETIKKGQVRELFKQGTNILDEFGITHEGTRDIGVEPKSSRIRVHTPSVALDIQGEEVNFIMQGWFKPNHLSPKSPSPNSYEYISAHRVKEGDRNFEDNTDWLFHIHEGRIETPFDEAINDPQVIGAASDLFDVIQQSLSETHTPRPQQAKPEPRPSFFRRILSPRKA